MELQIGIFQEAATLEPHLEPAMRLAMLQKVSTLWWTIIRDAPSLWRHVNVFRPGVEASLQRSGNLPLWVEISHRFGSPASWTVAEPACRLTAAQAHRWKTVTINSNVDHAFLAGLRGPFPVLECANLTMVRPLRVIVPFRGGPKLKQLRLNDVPVEWEHIVLPSLEILVIENYTVLPFNWAQILIRIMASAPRLRTLQLSHISSTALAPISGPSNRSQLISSLNTLHINKVQSPVLDTILSHIDGKRLTTFRILGSVLPQTVSPFHQNQSLFNQLARNLSLPSIHMHIMPEKIIVSHTDVCPRDYKSNFLIAPPEAGRGWTEILRSLNRFLAVSTLTTPVHLNFMKPGGPLIEEISNRIQEMTSLATISFGPHISIREATVILRIIHALPTQKVPNLTTIILGFSCEYEESTSDFAKLMKILPALMNKRPDIIVQDTEGNAYGPNVQIFLDAANPNYVGHE